MNTSANLVPTECLIRRARRRRRNVWLTVTLAAGVFCGPLWALRAHESATAEHLRDQLAAAEVSLAADERALQQDVTEHNALIDAADQVASLWHPQPWSGRLAELARKAPQQVLLTELTVQRDDQPGSVFSAHDTMTETRLTMTLRGLALDHPALIQFIRTVEDSREFGKVELVRATREPYRSGLAVMFELRCPVEGGR